MADEVYKYIATFNWNLVENLARLSSISSYRSKCVVFSMLQTLKTRSKKRFI